MKKLNELKIVLVILLVVLVLVLVKTTGENRFKHNAKDAVEAVTGNDFLVSINDFKAAENQYLIVDLNESGSVQFENPVKIPFEKLLEESSLEKFKSTENKILLISDDNSVAAKAWVILNQLGLKNVYILANEENQEVLKYEFKTDTVALQ